MKIEIKTKVMSTSSTISDIVYGSDGFVQVWAVGDPVGHKGNFASEVFLGSGNSFDEALNNAIFGVDTLANTLKEQIRSIWLSYDRN